MYVMNKKGDMELLRNQFMTYIGGQVKVQCHDHNLPLIVSCKKLTNATNDLMVILLCATGAYI